MKLYIYILILVVKMPFIRKRVHAPLATKDSTMSRGRQQAARVKRAFQHHAGGQRHTGGLFQQLHSCVQKEGMHIPMLSISVNPDCLSFYLLTHATAGIVLKSILTSFKSSRKHWDLFSSEKNFLSKPLTYLDICIWKSSFFTLRNSINSVTETLIVY